MKAESEAAARVLDPDDVRRATSRIAHEVVERNRGARDLVLVGLHTRGVPLARRIAAEIGAVEGLEPPVGTIDIAFYRDDIASSPRTPSGPTSVPVPIDGATVVLVDDVMFTGRSARAAMDAICDFGRPHSIQLAVLVDRGHRELPVHPDYTGRTLFTTRQDDVRVRLKEIDGTDAVDHVSAGRAARSESDTSGDRS